MMRQTRFARWAEEAEARRFRELALFDDQVQVRTVPGFDVFGLAFALLRRLPGSNRLYGGNPRQRPKLLELD